MTRRTKIRTVIAMSTYTAQLRAVPGFERCRGRRLASLARSAERLDVTAGSVLVGPGDRWSGVYVVVTGEAVAETQGWSFLLPEGARIERTSSTPADLTVRARTDLRVLAIGRRHDVAIASITA
jgi:CRP-like cAMP-binding protein